MKKRLSRRGGFGCKDAVLIAKPVVRRGRKTAGLVLQDSRVANLLGCLIFEKNR